MSSIQNAAARVTVPLPFRALAIGMLVSYLSVLTPGLGTQLSFLGWMLPLLACLGTLKRFFQRQRFPYRIWLPWMLYSIVYLLAAEAEHSLQRTIMIMTPVIVGMGFSCLLFTPALDQLAHRWLDHFFFILLAAAGMSTGLLSTGALSETSGFATGSITASLMAAWYAVRYAAGERNVLKWWALLAVVPILANTRTGMLAVGITLPLTLAPYSLMRRAFIIGAAVVVGLLAFQTEHVQRKMFFSGHGTLQQAIDGVWATFSSEVESTGDFATSGRKPMTIFLQKGISEAYWFGHGANTTEAISLMITGVSHPHNDWLRLQYEYGTVGMLLFLLAMVMQAINAWRGAGRLRQAGDPGALYLYAGATSFLPMALFMFSDNVIIYVAWFGNLQFAMLGLGYAALRDRRLSNQNEKLA